MCQYKNNIWIIFHIFDNKAFNIYRVAKKQRMSKW
jgi:hypothetical protein